MDNFTRSWYNFQMLLAIDLGNTNIVFGLFKGACLVREWRFPSDKYTLPKIKGQLDRIIVASVVPGADSKLRKRIQEAYQRLPFFVTASNIPGLKVRLKNKKEIGADRVVDALAAKRLYGVPAIVVDFGTATTFDVISAKGEYLGGAIAPGITMARDALYQKTAKLPKVRISPPKSVIGRDTVSAMQSGLVHGYVAMVEGMVKKLKSKIIPHPLNPPLHRRWRGGNPSEAREGVRIIATGGLAKLICKHTKVVDRIDAELTLKGLQMVGDYIFSRSAAFRLRSMGANPKGFATRNKVIVANKRRY